MSMITERLFIGSQINTPQDVADIRNAHVSHIIDCQAERDDNNLLKAKKGHPVFALLVPRELQDRVRPGFAMRAPDTNSKEGVAYLYDPTEDNGQRKDKDWFASGIDFAIGALGHPGYKVLTHCAGGVNRGPSMAYAILRAQGFNRAQALDLIHTQRPVTVGGIAYARDAEIALAQLGWTTTQED